MNEFFVQRFYRNTVFILSLEADTGIDPFGIGFDKGHVTSARNSFIVLNVAMRFTCLQVTVIHSYRRQNISIVFHNALGDEITGEEIVSELG